MERKTRKKSAGSSAVCDSQPISVTVTNAGTNRGSMKFFRDPIYEYISMSEEERRIVDTPWFQRLRHCAQNGPARLVYPSLSGSRFEHSIGVMELAGKAVEAIFEVRKYADDVVLKSFAQAYVKDMVKFCGFKKQDLPKHNNIGLICEHARRLLRLAGLLHDIGHFPLSHTTEMAFIELYWNKVVGNPNSARACHEVISADIVRHLAFDAEGDKIIDRAVARAVILLLICPPISYKKDTDISCSVFPALHSIIVGDYDVDRLDYLQRDGYLSGTGFGTVDVLRLLQSLYLVDTETVNNKKILKDDNLPDVSRFFIFPSVKGLSTVEGVVLERYKETCWVVNHHKALFYEQVTQQVAKRLLSNRNFLRKYFVKYDPKKYCDTDEIEKSALLAPTPFADCVSGSMIPFALFKASSIYGAAGKNKSKHFLRINYDFFITAGKTQFFDDIWFCGAFRELFKGSKDLFLRETLLNRCHTSVSLWKDLQGFKSFLDKVADSLTTNNKFANKIKAILGHPRLNGIKPVKWYVLETIKIVLPPLMVRVEYRYVLDTIIRPAIKKAIRKVDPKLHAYIAPVHWSKFFIKTGGKVLIDRICKNVISLNDASFLLKSAANYQGGILFFIYFAGESKLIAKQEHARCMEAAVEAFASALIKCWLSKDLETSLFEPAIPPEPSNAVCNHN